MESLRKQLIHRFMEERRLTHPHLSLLYDLAKQLIRMCHAKPDEKAAYAKQLEGLSYIPINNVNYHVFEVDSYYHRNIHSQLEVDIETPHGEFTVGQLDIAVKVCVSQITDLVMDIGDMYYMDFAINQEREEKVMEGL